MARSKSQLQPLAVVQERFDVEVCKIKPDSPLSVRGHAKANRPFLNRWGIFSKLVKPLLKRGTHLRAFAESQDPAPILVVKAQSHLVAHPLENEIGSVTQMSRRNRPDREFGELVLR